MRQRVLAAVSVLSLLLMPSPSAAQSAMLETPERGLVSTRPGSIWEHGLLSGNGSVGAVVMSHALDETVIFSHERMFLPERPPQLPTLTGPRLFELRSMIDRGLYQQASQFAFDLSGQDGFRYPDPFVPAFELGIKMDGNPNIEGYRRGVNFETGEASVEWKDAGGRFVRTLFVSRADSVAVIRIRGERPGSVNARLELRSREPGHERFRKHMRDAKATASGPHLTYRHRFLNAYPGSIHSIEGVGRVRSSTTGNRRAHTAISPDPRRAGARAHSAGARCLRGVAVGGRASPGHRAQHPLA